MSVKLGIIGYGIMGERLLRAAMAHDPARIAIAAVFDPSPASQARLATDFPDIVQAKSADALIEASDCVYIASPPASHLPLARAALAAGKAVFCEKPLATDLADARAFAREAADARFAVNFPFASSFAVAQLRDWVDQGVVGTPQRVDIEIGFRQWPRPWQHDAASWLDGPEEGGFTREVVSHFFFLTLRMLGDLKLSDGRVSFPEPGRSERAVSADLSLPGLPVALEGGVGITDKDDHNTWTLTGDKGTIRLRDWSFAERLDPATGKFVEAPDAIPNEQARPLVLARQLDKVAALTRGESQDLATLAEALQVQENVEALLARTG
jgi:predicted dehydrogenase